MNLLVEFTAAVGGVSAATDRYFHQALSIPEDVLFGGAALIGRAKVNFHADGFYEPCVDGVDVMIVPAGIRGPNNVMWLEVTDLIAFQPKAPDRWYRRTGIDRLIGEDNLHDAALREEMLPIYATPLSWLQHGAQGVCIIDWTGAVGLDLSNEIPAVACETVALAKRLQAALRLAQRGVPEIRVLNTELIANAA